MQVRLGDGRRFRMGGDALVRLGGGGLDLRRGQLIAWIDPGSPRGRPFRVRTRVGTASILGTTLFIDDSGDRVTFLSWEGVVRLRRNDGRSVRLRGGEVVTVTPGAVTPGSAEGGPDDWSDPRPLTRDEARRRRRGSRLLNGFQAPMATLPQVEAVLQAAPPAPAP
jgi:ferric-dicitrate binding protein FerR (iron transport regulator)